MHDFSYYVLCGSFLYYSTLPSVVFIAIANSGGEKIKGGKIQMYSDWPTCMVLACGHPRRRWGYQVINVTGSAVFFLRGFISEVNRTQHHVFVQAGESSPLRPIFAETLVHNWSSNG